MQDKPNAHKDEPKGSILHIRVTRQQKAKWVKQAQARGMKLRTWVCEKLDEVVKGLKKGLKKMIKKIYKPNSKKELQALCDDLSVNLGEIDTSKITDMSCLFYFQTDRTDYSGIENWDVSNVTDMNSMFWGAKSFNQDISKWNVSNVKRMAFMFNGALSFNQDLSGWQLDCIKDKTFIFKNSPLEKLVKSQKWDWSKYHEQNN